MKKVAKVKCHGEPGWIRGSPFTRSSAPQTKRDQFFLMTRILKGAVNSVSV